MHVSAIIFLLDSAILNLFPLVSHNSVDYEVD